MRKVTSYLFFAGSALFLLYACTKTGSSTTIIGNWVNRFDFAGAGRTKGIAFVINNLAYVGTGYTGPGSNDTTNDRAHDLWQYNVTNNSWNQMAYLPDSLARSNAMTFATPTKGYLIGGLKQDGITKLGDVWEYDPVANAWAQKTSFIGTPRMDAIAFCIGNIGYIAGGYDGNNYLKDFYSFDPTQNGGQGAWTSLGSMPGSKRRGGSAFVYQNKAYIVAGLDNTIYPSDFWSYDPVQPFASAWTQKNAIANVSPQTFDDGYTGITRANAAAFVMGVKGYLATGDAGSLYKSVWEYDFASDLWTQKSDFEVGALTGAVAFTVNGRGFVLTGNASSNYYSEFSEFHPFEAYNQYD